MKLKEMPFTKKTLKSIEACQEAIEFCERNRLFCNTPIKNLEIEGKYKRWAKWLNNRRELDYEYDTFGNLVKITYIDGWIETYMYEYDAAGNITRITYPDGRVETHDCDITWGPTRIKYPSGIVETYEYDTVGNTTKTSCSNGRVEINEYDTAGRLMKIVYLRDGVETCIYKYDIAGNTARIVYPNGLTGTHEYDSAGNPTRITYPTGEYDICEYDTVGNLTKISYSYGLIETYGYHKTKNEFTVKQRGKMLLHIYNPEGWV